jgi:hypothetical protein
MILRLAGYPKNAGCMSGLGLLSLRQPNHAGDVTPNVCYAEFRRSGGRDDKS